MINPYIPEQDVPLFREIGDRASKIAKRLGLDYPSELAALELFMVHSSGCPLRLGELLFADERDFIHDVFGIHNNLNHSTGELENFFVPRWAAGR